MVAVDVHVHLATREWLVDAMGPYLPSIERYFRVRPEVRPIDTMAAEYRAACTMGVLLAWDAERQTGRPPVPNEAVSDICRRFPDVFWGAGSVDPKRPDAAQRVCAAAALGLKALKVHPTLQGFDPADESLMPVWEAAAASRLVVITHSGTSGVGAREPGGQGLRIDLAQPIRWDPVAARLPQLRIVLAHVGWPWHLEALAMALHKANVYLDISGWKYRYLPEEVVREMRTRLQDQFLFGTDYPMFDLAAQREEFERLALPEPARTKILRDNALRLFAS